MSKTRDVRNMEKESVIQKIQKLQSNAENIGSTGEALNINNYNETDEHRIIRLLRERCEELGKYIQKQDEVMKIRELLIEKQSEFIDRLSKHLLRMQI